MYKIKNLNTGTIYSEPVFYRREDAEIFLDMLSSAGQDCRLLWKDYEDGVEYVVVRCRITP